MEYNRPIYDIKINDALHLGVDEIAFVHDPAIEELWVAMNKEVELKLAQLEDKQILVGAALIPDKLIYRVDKKGNEYYIKFSADTIKQIIQRYFTQNKQINFNLEHNKKNDVNGVIIESWVVEDSMIDKSVLYGLKNVPVGTWMISVKVEDKEFWDEYVKTNKVRGFSIEGAFGQELVEMMANRQELIDPKAGESKDEFISRCIAYNVGTEGMENDQAAAICYTKWDEQLSQYELTTEEAEFLIKEVLMAQESYSDYPQAASNAAKKALKYKEENPGITCGTRVGWARANQLSDRRGISEETIARMASFARHLQWENVPYDEGCGGLMVDAWGGRAGIEWAQRKLRQIRNTN
jgi:hypothetical protein